MLASPIARLVVIAILLAGLLVPLGMTWGLVTERAQRRDTVAAEIGAMWGGAQRLAGPALTVLYRCGSKDAPVLPPGSLPAGSPNNLPCTATAVVLPDVLAITGTVDPSLRRRGVFDVVVYRAHLTMRAQFRTVALDGLSPRPLSNTEWDGATIALGVADPKGLEQKIRGTCNQQALDFRSGAPASLPLTQGLSAHLPLTPATHAGIECTLELDVKGTRSLMFFPAGSDTTLELASSWPHPSFGGWILPERYDVRNDGFTAAWRSGAYGRPLPGMWTSQAMPANLMKQAEESEFGLSLVQPIIPTSKPIAR